MLSTVSLKNASEENGSSVVKLSPTLFAPSLFLVLTSNVRIHLGCRHPCCVVSLQDSRRVIQELESKTQQLSKELKAANDEKSVSVHVINSRVTF